MADDPDRRRWRRLQELFEGALEHAAGERDDYLEAEAGDAELAHEVRALVAQHERDGRLDAISEGLSALAGRTDGAAHGPPRAPEGGQRGEGERIGPYRIEGPLGQGGMGTVYRVRHEGRPSDPPVALKVLRAGAADDRLRRRFLAEREILGRLDHPNIARQIDTGVTADGAPYLVLELVDGVPIDEHCDEQELLVPDRMRLFVTVCEAVSHAHDLGVVHRDLKPANILVTEGGDVRLLDFGIAKILDPGAFAGVGRRTTTGVYLLTPEYASPEQLLGEPITPRSDVYQLGLLLYVLLTARIPSVSVRVSTLTGAAVPLAGPLLPPSSVAQRTGRDPGWGPNPGRWEVARARGVDPESLPGQLEGRLDAVALRAVAEDADRRYPSAARLAEDVRAYLDDPEGAEWSGPVPGPASAGSATSPGRGAWPGVRESGWRARSASGAALAVLAVIAAAALLVVLLGALKAA